MDLNHKKLKLIQQIIKIQDSRILDAIAQIVQLSGPSDKDASGAQLLDMLNNNKAAALDKDTQDLQDSINDIFGL